MKLSRLAAAPEIATVTASPRSSPGPSPLHETATCEGRRGQAARPYRVDDFARITGLVRISRRGDVALAGVPTLAASTFDGSLLLQVGAHLLHHGPKAARVSWLYERPASLLNRYEARIDRIDLGHWGGRRPPDPVSGPWECAFTLPTPDRRVRLISRVD